ncbi:MAG: hypothetical protein K1Y01_06620 [Vicinamibacteria bacterium]|nr:hypothetical protein [Vicinamibacteria bacterium]
MAIKKQEFYEGAAIHQLVRGGGAINLKYEDPFFIANNDLVLHIKYSTKGRSPWAFTFMPDERALLKKRAEVSELVMALVCGSDGVALLAYGAFCDIAGSGDNSIHLSSSRRHGQHYTISGPDGALDRKIAPSLWPRLIANRGRS